MKTIVVPIDFSPASINASRYAVQLAEDINAEVYLCHVSMPTIGVVERGVVLSFNGVFIHETLESLNQVKWNLQREFGTGVEVICILRTGFLIEQIREITASMKNNLVVIGINEQEKAQCFLTGNNVVNIMQSVNCPVIVVPSGASYKGISSIAFVCDYQCPKRPKMIDKIVDFAKSVKAKLDTVYINEEE